ncbi:hypothetical protein MICA_2140 [Micavibrio aeruginosavorus ARL-13]|uniref:Uncharacterized protein n=1 Tax=Micavibrio aeruginosavorus (strain ARL-13) TaxID=856793 RepID=G2KQW9_MICAA|nr:hypothetical protein MICA_2140 [Micavibrio aeruginosavorus ARL-13]
MVGMFSPSKIVSFVFQMVGFKNQRPYVFGRSPMPASRWWAALRVPYKSWRVAFYSSFFTETGEKI